MSITFEAVTENNKYGQIQRWLDPTATYFELPRYETDYFYNAKVISGYIEDGFLDVIQLLPEVVVETFDRKGNLILTKTVPSVRRDLQAIVILSNALWQITQFPKGRQVIGYAFSEGLKKSVRIASERVEKVQQQYASSCDDPEALFVLLQLYLGIKKMYSQIRQTFTSRSNL